MKAIANMFPLKTQTFYLVVLLVLKVANILKLIFSGPTPIYIVVHGTSIQVWLGKKVLLIGNGNRTSLYCIGFHLAKSHF